jgi:hypothetical protein
MNNPNVSQQEAAKYLLSLKKASLSYKGYVDFMHPGYKRAPFQEELVDVLNMLEQDALVSAGGNPIRKLLVNMPPRHAKLLADDTPMLTTDGWRAHGDLKVGDHVIGVDGKPTKIVAVSPKSVADVLVTTSEGHSFLCNEDHLWTVFDRSAGRWVTVETRHFLKNSRLGKPVQIIDGTRCRFMLPIAEAVHFPAANLPINPYVLGAWLGDGTSGRPAITHHENDTEVVESVSGTYPVSTSFRHVVGDKKTLTTCFGSGTRGVNSEMTNALQAAGVWKDKHIPSAYFRSSIEQRLELLAGLIDTDGSVDKASRVRFVTTSEKLRDGVFELAAGLGFRPYVMSQSPSVIGKLRVYCVGFQPTMCIPTRIPRKRIARIASQRRMGIAAVRKVGGSAIGQCITVDREDGLYLAGRSLTVTHNSFYGTVNFSAYALGRKPFREVMNSAYNAELAGTFGRGVRDLVTDPKFRKAFSKVQLSRETRAVDFWKTMEGGAYYAIGLGGTTVGRGANVLGVDDPYKSREEAESISVRRKVWDYYAASLLSRLQPDRSGQPPMQLVILQRWHPDDLAGRIMEMPDFKRGEWMHLEYQALRTKDRGVYIRRKDLPLEDPRSVPREIDGVRTFVADEAETVTAKETVALWPERFPVDWLLKQQEVIGKREFDALYQQKPYIVGGNLIKENWFREFDPDNLPEFHALAIGLDTAFKTKTVNDYSVFTLAGITDSGDIYILGVWRVKMEYPDLKRQLVMLSARYRGQGLRGVWIEDSASGQVLLQELKKESGAVVLPWKTGSQDKMARAASITPLIEGGRVYIPRWADWLDDWMMEMTQFPSSKHDDQVDSFVIVMDVLSKMIVTGHGLFNAPIGDFLSDKKLTSDLSFGGPLSTDPRGWVGGFGAELKKNAWSGWGG